MTADDQPRKDLEDGTGSTPRKKTTPGNQAAKKIEKAKQVLRDVLRALSGKECPPAVIDDLFERSGQKWLEVYADGVTTDALGIDIEKFQQQRAAEADADEEEE